MKYLQKLVENNPKKFLEYEKYLSTKVFGHDVKIVFNNNLKVFHGIRNEKPYQIDNDYFVDKMKMYYGSENDLYRKFLICSNLFMAEIYGTEFMDDSKKFFKNEIKSTQEELAIEESYDDYFMYDELSKAYGFYYGVVSELNAEFNKISQNKEKISEEKEM